MECKEAYSNLKMFTKHVLIETLWNVKCCSLRPGLLPWFRINRNIVECKVYNHFFISPVNICINRNIVECKVGSTCCLATSRSCINRNIVECKASSTIVSSPLRLHVLIETLWNVKQGMENRRKEMNLVLIETLWNVKTLSLTVHSCRC